MANDHPTLNLIGAEAWAILRFPSQILAVGIAILLLCLLFAWQSCRALLATLSGSRPA